MVLSKRGIMHVLNTKQPKSFSRGVLIKFVGGFQGQNIGTYIWESGLEAVFVVEPG